MQLSRQDKEILLRLFPNFKLSYETIIHKKVYSDLYLTIPRGKKHFAWFTLYKGKPVCFLLEKDNSQQRIVDISAILCCFNDYLCLGTIVYGTVFTLNDNRFFNIEDVIYYKNNYVGNVIFERKIHYFNLLFENIRQIGYSKEFIIFGLPIIRTSYKELIREINELQYTIEYIQHRSYKRKDYNLVERYNSRVISQEGSRAVFKVRADDINDIYDLYCYDKGEKLYGKACIPNIKSSMFMNSIFRNIKENKNLDAMEESDDEEEFENISDDKFNLNKTMYMECVYNKKFKKWQPLKESHQRKMICYSQISFLEKI
uniref:mRNA capping enzyme adenylation domain-containing protein n=1 Tax=viral metagenome TaxID=1070528 RepID=A0A6C0KG71_9ZZZZ